MIKNTYILIFISSLVILCFGCQSKDSKKGLLPTPDDITNNQPDLKPCASGPGNTETFYGLSQEQIFQLVGMLVVKFKNPEYKDHILLRSFSDVDKDIYFFPQNEWKQRYCEHIENRMKYINLYEDYYAVDWSFLYTTGIFGDKNKNSIRQISTMLKNEHKSISEIKKGTQTSNSIFIQDMQNLLVISEKWSDYQSFDDLLKYFANKKIDISEQQIIDSTPFTYMQFIYFTDILTQVGYSKTAQQELLFEYKNLGANNCAIDGLNPHDTNLDTWYNINVLKKTTYADNVLLTAYEMGINSDVAHNDLIQNNFIQYVKDALQSGKAKLPQSLL
ncbi:MAG TPA: hypothetical protein DEO38_01475 [Bacteroidales bacterium]|nr:hypothetical protein [Bacteroidales bacterium]